MAHVRFASGALASVVNSVLSARQESSLRIDCAHATVELTHLYGYSGADWCITPAPGVPEEEVATWGFPEPDSPSSHRAFFAHVYPALGEGRRPALAGRAGRVALEVATATYASALSGRPVSRTELRPGHPSYDRLPGDTTRNRGASWAAPAEHTP